MNFLADVFVAQVPETTCVVSLDTDADRRWEPLPNRRRLPIRCFDKVIGYFYVSGGDGAWNFQEAAEFATTMAALAAEHDQLRSQLNFRADHDLLTGLPNRGLGIQKLSDAVERVHRYGSMCALISVDLDKFKEVNDSYGHAAGDTLLTEVADLLKSRLRSGDTVARIGGDEFMIVLEQISSPEAAEGVAKSLLAMFEKPFHINGRPLVIGASMGIALCMGREKTPFELCRDADDAMYLAKSRGRCQYQLHTAEISKNSEWRHKIAEKLRRALAMNRFKLLYQGQYTTTGTLVGVEALIRFADPADQDISPVDFLRIAEEFGLIHQVGDWVLQEVFNQIGRWQRSGGPQVPVAINVSRTQFSRAEFVPSVTELVRNSGIDPALIELEITENAVMHDIHESARQIAALKKMGMSIAIDDFGTGYSSLSSLHELPVDKLKLDRAFVQAMQNEGGTLPIVEAALFLAKSFKMKMIAEGVETRDQLDLLAGLGCEYVQGYLLGRPLAPETFVSSRQAR
ncbi:MAG: EAL domain-containing protein [Acidobacteriales bacterium]|nr:EAL domain-containing protein [Terriglobales bacterium]